MLASKFRCSLARVGAARVHVPLRTSSSLALRHARHQLFKQQPFRKRVFARYFASEGSRQQPSMWTKSRQHKAVILALAFSVFCLSVPILMFPVYRALCQQFGWSGQMSSKSQAKIKKMIAFKRSERSPEEDEKRLKQKIHIKFDSNLLDMPWEFRPLQDSVMVTPGETALAFFEAENTSDKPMVGIASYNVVPPKAALFFTKIECFCFEEQRLRPHEKIDMPVLFYIDPEILNHYKIKDVRHMTLQYTFFDATGDDDEFEDEDEDRTYSLGPSAAKAAKAKAKIEAKAKAAKEALVHDSSSSTGGTVAS